MHACRRVHGGNSSELRASHTHGLVCGALQVLVLEVPPAQPPQQQQPQHGRHDCQQQQQQPPQARVWDLDGQPQALSLPCSLRGYAQHALQAYAGRLPLPPEFQRCACSVVRACVCVCVCVCV
jgi:hypothetical protein